MNRADRFRDTIDGEAVIDGAEPPKPKPDDSKGDSGRTIHVSVKEGMPLGASARQRAGYVATMLREAGGDHFYGAWNGGSKAQGGGPAATFGRDDGENEQINKALAAAADHEEDTESAWIVGGDQTFVQKGAHDEVRLDAEAREWAVGGHMIHNHPGGRPLSVDDLEVAANLGAASTSIVSSAGRWTVIPGSRGWGEPAAIRRAYDRAWDKQSYIKQSGNDALAATLRSVAKGRGWTLEEPSGLREAGLSARQRVASGGR